jgi:hypothetical protein
MGDPRLKFLSLEIHLTSLQLWYVHDHFWAMLRNGTHLQSFLRTHGTRGGLQAKRLFNGRKEK